MIKVQSANMLLYSRKINRKPTQKVQFGRKKAEEADLLTQLKSLSESKNPGVRQAVILLSASILNCRGKGDPSPECDTLCETVRYILASTYKSKIYKILRYHKNLSVDMQLAQASLKEKEMVRKVANEIFDLFIKESSGTPTTDKTQLYRVAYDILKDRSDLSKEKDPRNSAYAERLLKELYPEGGKND